MTTKYYLYARKSTEDDDHQIMSIEAQLFELREYARRENLEIIEEFTESKSAKQPGREQFGQMVAKIEQNEGVGILTWHPDRLARNSVDGGKVIYLVDIKKIVSLRFPTFWFEPTPQGLFMLQVAFGQSKYYSDNLVENINRGFRQKIRRGEWLTKAPLGYINNPKTRTIEPHPVQAKVVVKAFEQFATGKYTYETLANYMFELGAETKNRTPLGKASIWRMLTNRAYLGLTRHKGEYFEGTFQAIISPTLFEAAQEVLKRKAKPRKSEHALAFPFMGLMTCGYCGCAITGCNVTGKSGNKFRYYRCTKKKIKCTQPAIQEQQLAEELKDQLRRITLPNEWTDKMFAQVEAWEKQGAEDSQRYVQQLKVELAELEEKLNRLVGAYVDEEIPKENYLNKKEEILKRKLKVNQNLKATKREGRTWIKPLREWILLTKKATFVASSDDLEEIKQAVQTVGLNPTFLDKKVSAHFRQPWDSIVETLMNAELKQSVGSLQFEKNVGSDSEKNEKNSQSPYWWR